MINIIQKNEIIVRHKNGQTIKSISKELNISRNTVRNYIREYESSLDLLSKETDKVKITIMQELICAKPSRKTIVKPCFAFNKEVEQRFCELIEIDKNRDIELGNNKQHLTAALLHRT